MSRQSIRTGRTVVVVRYRAGVRTCRCMPGSWVVSTGGTWGRDSKGGVGLQGAGCRVQGAGCRRCECRREGQVQVQQGAAGCGRSVAGADAEGTSKVAGVTSRESRLAIMFLPLWSTTPASGCPDGIREPGNGTRVQGRRTYGCTVVYRTTNCRRGWPRSLDVCLILLGWVCRWWCVHLPHLHTHTHTHPNASTHARTERNTEGEGERETERESIAVAAQGLLRGCRTR